MSHFVVWPVDVSFHLIRRVVFHTVKGMPPG